VRKPVAAACSSYEPGSTELSLLNRNHPDQPLYLYWLARVDYYQRRYEDSVAKLQRVIQLDPESPRAYDNLGLSFDMMGRYEEARVAFEKAVEFNRRLAQPSPWPPHNLGDLLLRLGSPLKQKRLCGNPSSTIPDSPWPTTTWAVCSRRKAGMPQPSTSIGPRSRSIPCSLSPAIR